MDVFQQTNILYSNAVQRASHTATQTDLGCTVIACLCTGVTSEGLSITGDMVAHCPYVRVCLYFDMSLA